MGIDRGEPIVEAMLAHLRTEGVLIPAAAVLERIGLAARVRARKRVFQVLAEGLTDAAHDALEKLLTFDPAVPAITCGPGSRPGRSSGRYAMFTPRSCLRRLSVQF